jgi:hypothetical protein
VALNEALAAGGRGDADERLTRGEGDAERRADGEWEGVRDGDGDNDGDGDAGEGSALATGMVGIEGSTTVGRAASSRDGPTARTATHTTSATRMITADRKMRRAGLIGEECLAAGKNRSLREINGLGRGHYPMVPSGANPQVSPCPWPGGRPPG